MNETPNVQILLIEDSETDVLLLRDAFADLDGFAHELTHVQRLAEGLTQLKEKSFDVVLLDLGLPDSQGVDTFTKLHRHTPNVPVLVLTALNDEFVGVRAMKLGAQDYLIKNLVQPRSLARAIRYAIERQRSTAELIQSQRQLRHLAARLQDVREAERTHIAREVHDELGQMLTALKMDLRWIEKRLAQSSGMDGVVAARAKLLETEKLTDRTIETVQRVALELRPGVLDNLGLAEAIRDEARRFESRTGIKMTMNLPGKLSKLKPETVNAFFRIFQELLTNVARHAGARAVTVRLAESNGELQLIVQDDGKGIPADALARRTSLGLLGMSERAISLSGEIQFEGAPGRGTRATLRIPIAQT
jgi:signal transduction histidine kinase